MNKVKEAGMKQGVQYWYDEYGTLFCDPIEQSTLVGGIAEQERNDLENPARMDRILKIKDDPFVLDFGCGHGLFIDYLIEHNVRAWGYDKFYAPFATLPAPGSVDVITMIEVVEHLSDPFPEFQIMFDALKPGGYVMIESSFADWTTIDMPYVNPEAGHCTIHSHAGLTHYMKQYGFEEAEHINRNVRLYRKP